MALVGGGGAGNVAGSNPSGTSGSLNYIGDHAYAYSGFADFTNSEVTFLEFTTGSEYSILQIMPCRRDNDSVDSHTAVYINGEQVFVCVHRDGNRPQEPTPYMLLVPSFSKCEITMKNINNSNTLTGAVMLTGKVYA